MIIGSSLIVVLLMQVGSVSLLKIKDSEGWGTPIEAGDGILLVSNDVFGVDDDVLGVRDGDSVTFELFGCPSPCVIYPRSGPHLLVQEG